MSGDDVRANETRDAQQFPPAGAGTARAGNGGHGEQSDIRWVGEQRLMEGYCGREVMTGRAALTPTQGQPRPVAILRRPRGLVVRIGPRPLPLEPEPVAQAA